MATENVAADGRLELFRKVSDLHEELHACGSEVIDCKLQGRMMDALERLPHLQYLRDSLLTELKVLLQRD